MSGDHRARAVQILVRALESERPEIPEMFDMREQVEEDAAHLLARGARRACTGVVGFELQTADTDGAVTLYAEVEQFNRRRRRGFDRAHPVDEFLCQGQLVAAVMGVAKVRRRVKHSSGAADDDIG